MGVRRKILESLGLSKRRKSRIASFSNGGWAGGKTDRLTSDWNPADLSPASIHNMDGDMLRRRARDLVENTPHARSAVNAYIANVVECGITPKPKIDDPVVRQARMDAWNWWAGDYEPQADLSGHQHLYEMMALWLEEIIVGGGCLVRFRPLSRSERQGRIVPLALELIPEERFANDRDAYIVHHNGRRSNNPIIGGVEIDASTGRHVAYWVRRQHPNEVYVVDDEPIRIPADQARYSFFRRRVGQQRGHTMLVAAVLWLWKLAYYTDNELMASTIKSCFSVLIEGEDDEGAWDSLDGATSAAVDANGNPLERIEPGIIGRVRSGTKVHGVGPNVPTSDGDAWTLFIQRCIAMAVDLSYEEIGRDTSRGNFSQVRAGANADRKRFRKWQKFAIYNFCNPVYKRFTMAAVNEGLDGFPTRAEFVSDMMRHLAVTWRTPGWMSVNPKDDADAAATEIGLGLRTREQYVAYYYGDDWEALDEQRAREQESEQRLGLRGNQSVPQPQPQQDDNQ